MKKMFKKAASIFLSILLILSLTACSGNTSSGSNGSASVGDNKKFTIGICQLVQHVALDSATNGFMDRLKELMGSNVTFINQNASGDSVNCATIINSFVSKKVDLILANATAPLQAAASATKDIPILGTSITDYFSALEKENVDNIIGGNISGTSDLAPLKEQAMMIKEWAPGAKTCGILFCSSESNSEYQVKEMKKYLSELNIEAKEFSFTDSNDVSPVTTLACKEADVLYIPTDNTAASNAEAIANIVIPNKKVVITGEKGPCEVCGIATLSIDYYDLGKKTAEMAYDILVNNKNISTMPIEYAPKPEKLFNKNLVEKYGLSPLDGYKAIE